MLLYVELACFCSGRIRVESPKNSTRSCFRRLIITWHALFTPPVCLERLKKVDKTMFSDLTEEMRDNLKTSMPQTPFSDEDDIIPVVAQPKVCDVDWAEIRVR